MVYLPPTAVRDGVAELVRVNPDLEKIIIVTEKVSVHDAREIRAMGQTYGIDIFGANGLGVADAWNRVRIGGALGGDNPGRDPAQGLGRDLLQLRQLHHHHRQLSGHRRLGHDDLDLQRQGRLHPLRRARVHPRAGQRRAQQGGGDVRRARRLLRAGAESKKPIVACVVGRWKAKLTRAVGHAGAMAGSGDDAASKEGWFMEMFGVDGVFSPRDPICSAKGAVVTNIAHIPQALTKVMALNGIEPDFAPKGDLSLKAWFGNNQGLTLPRRARPAGGRGPGALRRADRASRGGRWARSSSASR